MHLLAENVDILKQKAQEYDVTIDTVIIDVYPEFQHPLKTWRSPFR